MAEPLKERPRCQVFSLDAVHPCTNPAEFIDEAYGDEYGTQFPRPVVYVFTCRDHHEGCFALTPAKEIHEDSIPRKEVGMGPCECADKGCGSHEGKECPQKAVVTLFRIDMNHTSVRFCEECCRDAFDSGLFTEYPSEG